jgi:hypothetical protein
MKWLILARNNIVKVGDLKKHSYTRVFLKDHYNNHLFEGKLDVNISISTIAEYFRE